MSTVLIVFGIGAVMAFIVGIAWPYMRDNRCAYCGAQVVDNGSVCPCLVKRYVRPDPIDDNVLFDEWCNGPGKDYPKHIKMMREIEGAPLRPFQMWDDGWEHAYYEWVKDRKTKHFHCAVCGRRADTRAELSCDRCVPYPAPPIPEHLKGPKL